MLGKAYGTKPGAIGNTLGTWERWWELGGNILETTKIQKTHPTSFKNKGSVSHPWMLNAMAT
jgi:hypothetical protein